MLIQAVFPRSEKTLLDRTVIYCDFWEIKTIKLSRSLLTTRGELTERALDSRELFRCERCGVIFTYDFGCDMGLPDYDELEKHLGLFKHRRRRALLPDALWQAMRADEDLRQMCDYCWCEICEPNPLQAVKKPMNKLREAIDKILTKYSGFCLDDSDEVEELADALEEELGPLLEEKDQ